MLELELRTTPPDVDARLAAAVIICVDSDNQALAFTLFTAVAWVAREVIADVQAVAICASVTVADVRFPVDFQAFIILAGKRYRRGAISTVDMGHGKLESTSGYCGHWVAIQRHAVRAVEGAGELHRRARDAVGGDVADETGDGLRRSIFSAGRASGHVELRRGVHLDDRQGRLRGIDATRTRLRDQGAEFSAVIGQRWIERIDIAKAASNVFPTGAVIALPLHEDRQAAALRERHTVDFPVRDRAAGIRVGGIHKLH